MKQTVYLDVLFFVNFTVDILIFLSVGVILQRREKWWRYVVSAAIGAAYSCAVFFAAVKPPWANIGAVLLYCTICAVFFKYINKKMLFKGMVITLLCAAFYGGLIFLLYLFTGIGSVMTFNNGALYIDIPVFAMLIFCFSAYGVIWLVTRILAGRSPKDYFAEILIELNGQQLSLRGFIDTGNKLSDPISGLPVIITSADKLIFILPQPVIDFFTSGNSDGLNNHWKKRIRVLPCSTVNGQSTVYAVKCDCLYLQGINTGECLVAVINKKISDTDEYDAILPSGIMNTGGGNNERITEKNIYPGMQTTGR